jgi:hypothetical protein
MLVHSLNNFSTWEMLDFMRRGEAGPRKCQPLLSKSRFLQACVMIDGRAEPDGRVMQCKHVAHGWTTRSVRRDATMSLRHWPRCAPQSRQVGNASAAHDSSPGSTLRSYTYRITNITYFPV